MKPTLEEEYPLDLAMDGEVRWTADEGYVGTTSAGKVFGIYGESSPKSDGDGVAFSCSLFTD